MICWFANLAHLCFVYRVSLKKGNFSDFRLISVLEVGFYFSHVFRNQNFELVSYSHSNYIHSESKLPKKTQKHAASTWFLECFSNFWNALPKRLWVPPPPPVPCANWTACLEQWQTQQALVASGWCHRACDRRQNAQHGQAVWRQGDQ